MPVTFHKHVLSNGLTVLAEADSNAHTAACGFFVKTGARDEEPPVMGVSHFLEHMMFKGTERRSADDVNREFDEIGADYNAYTTSEMTCFYAATLPEHLPRSVDILADILRPALRNEDFDTEKNVILEEIAMYKDNPFWVLYEKAMEEYYHTHTLAHRVLGTDDTIKALQQAQMKGYFDHRYSADNTVVAFAGKLDFHTCVRDIENNCGKWQRTGAVRDAACPPTAERDFTLRDAKVTRGYLLMVSPGPGSRDPRRYAAMMLAKVLGDPDNSRLHWSLIEPGIADEAQAAYEPRDGCGDVYAYASGDPEKIDEIQTIIEREIDGLVASLTQADLERLRNLLATSVVLAGERPSGRMQRLGRVWTYNAEYKTLEEELAAINAVTLDDVRAVYKAFPFRPRTVGRMLPA